MTRKNPVIELMLPGIATEIVACDLCLRCTNNKKTDDGVRYDLAICHSDKCPITKFRKLVGFRFNFSYTYFTDTENYEEIIPS